MRDPRAKVFKEVDAPSGRPLFPELSRIAQVPHFPPLPRQTGTRSQRERGKKKSPLPALFFFLFFFLSLSPSPVIPSYELSPGYFSFFLFHRLYFTHTIMHLRACDLCMLYVYVCVYVWWTVCTMVVCMVTFCLCVICSFEKGRRDRVARNPMDHHRVRKKKKKRSEIVVLSNSRTI